MGGYYDVDDILAHGQKIPCRFEIAVPKLGYLENSETRDLKKGASLEVPLWLAEVLAESETSPGSEEFFISLKTPPALWPRVLNALKTDASSVDLASQSPVFYALAITWLEMFQEPELSKIVMHTLRTRAAEIYDNCSRRGSYVNKLEEFEKKLLRRAHESRKAMKEYISGATQKT